MLLARSDVELRLQGPALALLEELVHAMGQPLTSLQLCRVLAMQGGAATEVLQDLAGQVESATEVYRALRMLLETREEPADVTEVGAVLRCLEGDWRRRAARRGGRLRLEMEESSGRVMGGVGVNEGLTRVFEAVLHGVTSGARKEMTVRGGVEEVVFSGEEPGVQIEETWTMRVARLRIELAGGSVAYGNGPMCARVRFGRA